MILATEAYQTAIKARGQRFPESIAYIEKGIREFMELGLTRCQFTFQESAVPFLDSINECEKQLTEWLFKVSRAQPIPFACFPDNNLIIDWSDPPVEGP